MSSRKTFYISGYDPRGPSSYYQLYKDESAKQVLVSGAQIQLGKRNKNAAHSSHWTIDYTAADSSTYHTDYEILRWDDIIRNHWPKAWLSLLKKGAKTYKHMLGSGAWVNYRKASKLASFSIVLPLICFVLAILIALSLSTGIGVMAYRFGGVFISLPIVIVTLYLVGKATFYLMEKYTIFWMLRGYIFASHYAQNADQQLDERVDYFVERIASALSSKKYDQVLLVAHSMGGIPATCTLAKLLKLYPNLSLDNFSILTLGHSVPLLSFLPEAKDFQQSLCSIAESGKIHWVDYSAPSDGSCFPLTSPFSQLCEAEAKRPVINRTPRFHKMFPPEIYKDIRKNKFRTHFQYLMASQFKTDYDYFEITATANIPD